MHFSQMLRVSVSVAFLASRCPLCQTTHSSLRLHGYSAMPSPTYYPYLRRSSTPRVCHAASVIFSPLLSFCPLDSLCSVYCFNHLLLPKLHSSCWLVSAFYFVGLDYTGPSPLEGLFWLAGTHFSFAIPACSRCFWLLQLESWPRRQCRYVSSLAAPRAPTSQYHYLWSTRSDAKRVYTSTVVAITGGQSAEGVN